MNLRFKGNFTPLFKAAWFLALTMLILIPVQILVFVVAPPPTTVEGFFNLFNTHPFLGLLSLDFLYLFNNAILIVIYLALFIALYHERPALILTAFIIGLIGIACYYPSNPAFEMLTLSTKFFKASPDQAKIFLAAGESLMAGYSGTTFNTYYVLSTICLLLFAFAILKSPNFKKPVGVLGLISGFFMIIPSSAGLIGIVFSLLSLMPWMGFILLLMNAFKGLSRESW